MQAADFMSDVAGSDHAVLVLKNWRNRTEEDLLAEVAEDLEFGNPDGLTTWAFEGKPCVPASQADAFFARLGVDLDSDLILHIGNWRNRTRDELIELLINDVDKTIADDTQAADQGQDGQDELRDEITSALLQSIDHQIEGKLAAAQKLREEAEEMMQQMRQHRSSQADESQDKTADDSHWFPEMLGRYPSYKTQAEFHAAMKARWDRSPFNPFNQ